MNSRLLDLTMDPLEEVRCMKSFRAVIKKSGKLTHFSKREIESLLIIYHKLTKVIPMDRKYFRQVMFSMMDFQNDYLIDRIFSALDRTNNLVLTMDSWIIGMSIFLRGTLDERIKFCFNVYDMMGDGYIKREHMFQALKNSIRGNPVDEDPEEVVKDMIEVIMKKMDHDRDGKLSFEDYKKSVWQNPNLLEVLGYCFPARPAVYSFMSTFTDRITTMHAIMFKYTPSKIKKDPSKLKGNPSRMKANTSKVKVDLSKAKTDPLKDQKGILNKGFPDISKNTIKK